MRRCDAARGGGAAGCAAGRQRRPQALLLPAGRGPVAAPRRQAARAQRRSCSPPSASSMGSRRSRTSCARWRPAPPRALPPRLRAVNRRCRRSTRARGRLQPCVLEAATLCAGGCGRLRPSECQAGWRPGLPTASARRRRAADATARGRGVPPGAVPLPRLLRGDGTRAPSTRRRGGGGGSGRFRRAPARRWRG